MNKKIERLTADLAAEKSKSSDGYERSRSLLAAHDILLEECQAIVSCADKAIAAVRQVEGISPESGCRRNLVSFLRSILTGIENAP